MTRRGVVVRSDNVSSLNPFGRDAMAAYGVTTVIDLRTESEVKASPSPFAGHDHGNGMPAYLHLPLVDDATNPIISEGPTMPDRYELMVEWRKAALGAIFTAVASAEGAVVVHCFAGKDRTGLVAAMLLSLAHVEDEAIGDDYAETDTQLAEKYEEWIAGAPPERLERLRDEMRCPPEWMLGTLDHIRRKWGGVEAYLEAGGVTPSAITRLQSMLGG
jgi:protein-tyrosine phosphatase